MFEDQFKALTGYRPMRWQNRLFGQLINGEIPAALDLPTGLGKTSVIAIWLIARAHGARLPRRLVYVVDRRAVVDQATEVAEILRDALECNEKPESKATHFARLTPEEKLKTFAALGDLKSRLCLADKFPISTLRGQFTDNEEWRADPASPAIIVGTVDMIGSRLLFEGYGVSRKMRPYHAGLLGADALIVLDEAHLVPPFQHLLSAIENGEGLSPRDEGARSLVPGLVLLPLSATQRERSSGDTGGGRAPFRLDDNDLRDDPIATQRLEARKRLQLEQPVEKDWDAALARKAWDLATGDGRISRVVVFCNRRDKKDEASGPSTMGVLEELEQLAKGNKKAGVPAIEMASELLVGGRRVKERQGAAENLKLFGFVAGEGKPCEKPTFLLATSAGEVGVDFDADHMVCDLAPWERMVQRLGRVNRRGGEGREAQAVVFDTSGIEKDEEPKERLKATLALLECIARDFDAQLSSASLLKLREQVGALSVLKASTPEPLRPALTRPLVDAWSMTSLKEHTGRPEIAPWLRGWIDDDQPQTTTIWRAHMPVRFDDNGRQFVPKKDANDFFEAARPHRSEKLESETYRVVQWLEDRAKLLLPKMEAREGDVPEEEEGEMTEAGSDTGDDDLKTDEAAAESRPLTRKDIVAVTLSASNEYTGYFTLGFLAQERKGREREDLQRKLIENILVVDARFGGLSGDGMLAAKGSHSINTADADEVWSKDAGFRVRRKTSTDGEPHHYIPEKEWRFEDDFAVRTNSDGAEIERLIVEHYKAAAQSENGRSVSNPQGLADHENCAEEKARFIGERLGLSGLGLEVLMLAAQLHDEGKRAERWQRAFKAQRDARRFDLKGPLAKTRGPIDQNVLDGYRHEFGSLAVFDPGHNWRKMLPQDVQERIEALEKQGEWFDLLQHLVASHHGFARPVIATRNCEDAPPSALEGRARDVALRFARLQKQWGPWGLAWWEALMRAADQQASRENDKKPAKNDPSTEKR